jgi:hypothetical protein
MHTLKTIFAIVAILFIWFDTKAFTEWARLLRISFLYKDFDSVQKSPMGHVVAATYVDYLVNKYNKSFLIQVVTCAECFSMWLNIIAMMFISSEIGGWWQLPINWFVTLLCYHVLRRVAKHE